MSAARTPSWGLIAALSLLAMTIVAVVILLVADDLEWLAAVLFVVGVLDALFLWRVMPRLTGATTQEQLDAMNAEAEAQAEILDGDWGVPPPSEPAEGQAPPAEGR